jgi:hypothetical protein
MKSDDSRETILRRRKFFVSSALGSAITVLTACPQQSNHQANQQTTSQTPVASVPAVGSSGVPEPAPPAPEPGPKVALPPLDVPAGVSDVAKGHYERLAQVVPEIHGHLDAAEAAIPSLCQIDDPKCSHAWSQIATHLANAEDRRSDLSPRCSGSSADARAFDERLALHDKAIGDRMASIQRRLDEILKTAEHRKRWEEQRAAAAVPQPCLKFRCDDW